MARILLTAPLPDDIGARFAVLAARRILKQWSESRVDEAIQSIAAVVESWKRENDVTGLHSALIDTIDVLFAIEREQKGRGALDDVSIDKLVALTILNEADVRPHVATKGGAVLAAITTSTLEVIGQTYDDKWLANIRRGEKVQRGGLKGQEIAHGTADEKIQRRTDHCAAFDHFRKTTKNITLAKEKAAEQCVVSTRTIERSLEWRRKDVI